jgi:transketolase
MGTVTQRDIFWNRVYDLAKENEDIIIVSADMGAPSLDKFRKYLSGQFINVGIAEQSAILISAGLALEGKKVFVYAIAPFVTYRCYDQIKLYLCAMNVPVTMVGVGAGFGYDDSGPTHHTVEDISIIRALPNMKIHSITDNVMASAFAEKSCTMTSPNYVRLDRKPMPVIYAQKHDFTRGVNLLRNGTDVAIVATGNMVHRAIEVAAELEKKETSAAVIDVYTIPINCEAFLSAVGDNKRVVTLEEHTLPGGFGSAVLEAVAAEKPDVLVNRIGLNLSTGYCYKYGGREYMQSLYGLDKKSIVESILKKLSASLSEPQRSRLIDVT